MKIPHPVEQPEEFHAWSLLYLDRELSPAEERAFAELLRASEPARRAFARAAQFDAQLSELRNQVSPAEPRLSARRRAAPAAAPGWVPALVAAGVLVVIVLAAAMSKSDAPRPREVASQPRVEIPEAPRASEPVPPPRPPEPPPESKPGPAPEPPKPPPSVEPPNEPAPPAPPAREKKPEPVPAPDRTTRVVARAGRLDQVQGQVFVLSGKSRQDASPGQELAPGQGLQTTRESSASLVFADGTRLDLSAETTLRDVVESPQKQAQLAQGTLSADVAKSPPGPPMKLGTPSAELTMVGSKFVVTADAKSTRVHVKDGTVRFARRKDGAALDVPGGSSAAAADGVEFAARPARVVPVLKGRSTADLEALYVFNEGKGAVVEDVSGVGEPLDLRIRDEAAVRWLPAGLLVRAPTAIVSGGPATKIIESCKKSHELSVEAWVTPANAAEAGPARILSLASGPSTRGFMLGQGEDKGPNPLRFTLRLRTGSTNENGMPGLMSDEGTVKAALTHLVVTRSRSGAAHFFVDGVERGRQTIGGEFGKWGRDLRLSLADEPVAETGLSWLGAYYLVAIYSRSLAPDEVVGHFKAGPTVPRAK